MKDMKIIDLSKNEKPSDFENAGLILITNITESNLKDAITAAESARISENVTAGILSGNINPLNKNMKRLSDIADAVILSSGKIEDSSRKIIEAISDLVTKFGFVNIEIEDLQEIFRDAGTVYFGAGTGKSAGAAALKASEMCGNMSAAKRVLMNITTGAEIMLSEISEASRIIETNADSDAQIIWGHVINESIGANVRVSIFAAMNDKGRL